MIPYSSGWPWLPVTGTCDPFPCRDAWSGPCHRLGIQGLIFRRLAASGHESQIRRRPATGGITSNDRPCGH